MKNVYKLFIFTFTTLFISGCSHGWLDVAPSDATDANPAIATMRDLDAARTGLYDGLQGSSSRNTYYAARMIYYGDVRGDDMQARDAALRSSACYEMRYTADNAPNMWNLPYSVLRRANNIIKAVKNNQIEDGTEAQIGKINAEALVVRALVHFDLVRIHAMPYSSDEGASLGVPIVLEPLEVNAVPTRSTVKAVYDQVIKDLTDAINSGYMATTETQGYLNVWSAKSLLSRVYLYMEDNENALKVAEDVIKSSPYKLWKNEEYINAWQKNDAAHKYEMIFELVNANSDDWTDREGIAYLYHPDGYADAIVTASYMDLLDEDDIRVKNLLFDSYYGRYFINKFPADPNLGGEMRLNNIPLLRLSEVYLTAAEAAFKEGELDKAAKYVNEIILRGNPDATELTENNVTLDRIIIERRKELVGEGQRFFDAMRNNETVVRYTGANDMGYHYSLIEQAQVFDRNYFRAILPIPVSEINANPNIANQQNPGY